MAVTRTFMPQILTEVRKEVDSRTSTQGTLTDIVRKNVKARAKKQAAARKVLTDKWAAMEAKRLEEAKTKRGNIRIYVPDESGNTVAVGPIQIASEDNIEAVQDVVFEWLKANKPSLVSLFEWGVIMAMRDDNGELVPVAETAQMFEAKAGQISMLPKEPPPPEPEVAEGEGEEGAEAGYGGEGTTE